MNVVPHPQFLFLDFPWRFEDEDEVEVDNVRFPDHSADKSTTICSTGSIPFLTSIIAWEYSMTRNRYA
jgi:hypothetical protein